MAEGKLSKELSSNIDSTDRKKHNSVDVTESERELAQGALTEFNKNNFSAAVPFIVKLQSSRPKDIKVLSNKAVVDYYNTGLRKTETFQKILTDICNQAGIKLEEIKSSDEVEASVIRLNRCTVWYHLQQLHSAKSLLESMYNGLESLEESVSIGLGLLLAEVLLGLSLPGRALAVLAHTEATFLPQPLPPQTASTKPLHSDKDSRSPDKTSNKENMTKSMSHANTSTGNSFNRANIMNSHASGNDSISGSSEMRCSADQELLRGKLQLLRLRSLLQMRITRVAKKELKAFVSHAVTSGNPLNVTLVMLKSQLEYLKGSYKKSIKVLNQCSAIPPSMTSYNPCISVAYYNNLGVIHFAMQKPTLACLYFQKALQELKVSVPKENSKAEEASQVNNLYSNGSESAIRLCYNLGISLMHMNKPTQAFEFLLEVAKSHATNPRLWLRLAECCIAIHRVNIQKDSNKTFQHHVIGSGPMKRICIMPNTSSHNKKLSDQQVTTDPALPVPTLEFARLCLRNCLELIPENVSATFLTDEQEASGVLPDLYSSNPSCPMRGSQIINVKLRCLACSAYASLCLGDCLVALMHAQTLLSLLPKLPQVDPMLKLVAHLYAGEALVLLGRVDEAIPHFDPKVVGEIPTEESFVSSNSCEGKNRAWYPHTGSNANKLLQYNLSVSYALRGQFEKANVLIREFLEDKNGRIPTQVVLLALYVNLQLGCTDSIGAIIEKGLISSSFV